MGIDHNALVLTAYDSSGNIIANSGLENAEAVLYSTVYPGGVFESCTFFVPRNPNTAWTVAEGQTLIVRNGSNIAWDGKIVTIAPMFDAERMGNAVSCVGFWGDLLMTRRWRKWWADTRTDVQAWYEPTTAFNVSDVTSMGIMTLDRNNRLRFTPKPEPFCQYWYHRVQYVEPTGETVKRVTFNYSMSEDAFAQAQAVYYQDAPGGLGPFTDLGSAYDSNPTTASTCTMTSDDYLFIGAQSLDQAGVVRVTMGTAVNTNSGTLSAVYWAGTGWATVGIVDNTSASNKCLAQSGDITFGRPTDWARTTVNGLSSYWLRLQPNANLTAAALANVKVGELQDWSLFLYNVAGGASDWTTSTTGTGAATVNLSTPSGTIFFYFRSNAAQTPPSSGTVYGQISNLTVYSTTSSITLTNIAKDVAGTVTELSADTSYINTNTYTIAPYISEGSTLADILMDAAAYSDASFNSWAVGVRERTLGTDNKPVLFAETYPALTSTDYVISVEELGGVFSAQKDITAVRNWIALRYTDAQGRIQYVTPDDNANLKGTASIAAYGERQEWLDVGTTVQANAVQVGRRLLAARKDPQWVVTSTIDVIGSIRNAQGDRVPACEVRAGKRIKIQNWLGDVTAAGLIFLITGTTYDDTTETVSISVGQPSQIDTLLANLARMGRRDMHTIGMPAPVKGSFGGGALPGGLRPHPTTPGHGIGDFHGIGTVSNPPPVYPW